MITLKKDSRVIVTLNEQVHGVYKQVFRSGLSGFRYEIPPEEMVKREIKALELLKGIEGIPVFLYSQPEMLVTKYMKGIPLGDCDFALPQDYFSQLRNLVKECEKKGVYRIGQDKQNFIVREDNTPGLVGFSNILFKDDFFARMPRVLNFLVRYSSLRIKDLEDRLMRV